MKKTEYLMLTREERSAYHIYTILDTRNRNLYIGYTLHANGFEDAMYHLEPDFLSSYIHQYMWQEGIEHFVCRTYALADAPPTCIQDKRDAEFMKKQVIAQIHDWNYLMERHAPEDRFPLVRIVLADDDITLEAKEVVVVPKERVLMGEIANRIIFDSLNWIYSS